eukprot:scaffold124122_cov36-Phaeocystis_antarctica.AAC.1
MPRSRTSARPPPAGAPASPPPPPRAPPPQPRAAYEPALQRPWYRSICCAVPRRHSPARPPPA